MSTQLESQTRLSVKPEGYTLDAACWRVPGTSIYSSICSWIMPTT